MSVAAENIGTVAETLHTKSGEPIQLIQPVGPNVFEDSSDSNDCDDINNLTLERTHKSPKITVRKFAPVPEFTIENIKSHSAYIQFIKTNPYLKSKLDICITKLISWSKSNIDGPDFYFDHTQVTKIDSDPYQFRGSWGVDDSYSETCTDWDQARDQMGTTNEKFSLNESRLMS